MSVYYMGQLVSGEPRHDETKTTWRSIGDKVIFALGQFKESDVINITVQAYA